MSFVAFMWNSITYRGLFCQPPSYVYVGSGGERYGWHGRNGDDSILTLCGKTYVAIGGGAGGGFSGGSGGGGQSITGQIGKGLQTKSASGGIGHDGFGDEGEIRCGGGGPAARSGISGDLVVYAKGGVDEVCSPSEAKGEASTGSGASFGGWDGPSFFKLAGGSGIVVLRYTVKRPARASFQCNTGRFCLEWLAC